MSRHRAHRLTARAAQGADGRGGPRREWMTRCWKAVFAAELDAWHGRQPLWRVFWGYGVLTSCVLAVLYALAMQQKLVVMQQVLLILLAGYTAWILVAIWRCADNSSNVWGLLARGLTVAWAGNAILLLAFLQADLLGTFMGR